MPRTNLQVPREIEHIRMKSLDAEQLFTRCIAGSKKEHERLMDFNGFVQCLVRTGCRTTDPLARKIPQVPAIQLSFVALLPAVPGLWFLSPAPGHVMACLFELLLEIA